MTVPSGLVEGPIYLDYNATTLTTSPQAVITACGNCGTGCTIASPRG